MKFHYKFIPLREVFIRKNDFLTAKYSKIIIEEFKPLIIN